MTTDELRAAAERLADLDLGMYQTPSDDDACIRAGVALGRAWLAEHPADDEEPITEDWLMSVGFKREMQPAASNHLTLRHLILSDDGADIPARIILTKWEYSDAVRWSLNEAWIPSFKPKTRGEVRHLLIALGLKEQP